MAAASPTSARLPIAGVIVVLLVGTAALLGRCLGLCEGRLVYPLDDTYIHMTMARNLAIHGSWGITPGAFEPASSSPLWTLLLAGMIRVFGAHDALPLVLGLLCMVALVVVLDHMLRGFIARPVARAAVVMVILPAVGLPGLAVSGMEPVLHMLLALLLAWTVARRLVGSPSARGHAEPMICVLTALSVLVRFESLFVIGSLAVASLLRRRPLTAAALVAGAGAAMVCYTVLALPQGGLWLPNPVLLKNPQVQPGDVDPWLRVPSRFLDAFRHSRREHLLGLFIAAGWLMLPRRGVAGMGAATVRLLLAVMVATLLTHMQLAQVDNTLRRYEAYIVLLGVFGVAAALASGMGGLPDGWADGRAARLPRVPATAIATLFAVLFVTPFVFRGVRLVGWTPPATQNIYEQQFQMARFVRERFRGSVVAINDLGAVSYYGDARIVDLWGLSTMAIARAVLEKRYDTAFIERFCASERVELALAYESWFVGRASLPRAWARVARWTIRGNVSAGDSTVTLFATDPDAVERVREAARGFAPTLPRHVVVEELP